MKTYWEQILKALLVICGGEGYETRTLDLCDFRFQFKIFKDEHPLVEVRMYDYMTSGLIAFFMEGEEKAKWQSLVIKLLVDLDCFPSLRSSEMPGVAVFHPPGSGFGEKVFLEYLAHQKRHFNIVCLGAWTLGPGIFAANVAMASGLGSSAFMFYYDKRAVQFRDSRKMGRISQLLLANIQHGYLTATEGDPIWVFWFEDGERCPIGTLENTLNVASQFLVGIDGQEIMWLAEPKEIQILE